jgi:hypothetical protein
MKNWLRELLDYSHELLLGNRGGGKEESTTIVEQPPAPKPPSASEVAQEQAKAQLQYTPEMYEAYYGAQQKYAPQMAQQNIELQQKYAPMLQALYQQMYPSQSGVIEAMAGRSLEQLASPTYQTPEQKAAELAGRQEQVSELQRAIQTSANLGGGLYGGRRELREERATSDLLRAFEEQDYNRRLQQQYAAMQQAVPLMQILYPQVQQPQVPNMYQSAVPSADNIYNAYAQRAAAQQPEVFYNPAQQSPAWSMMGQIGGGIAGTATKPWYLGG